MLSGMLHAKKQIKSHAQNTSLLPMVICFSCLTKLSFTLHFLQRRLEKQYCLVWFCDIQMVRSEFKHKNNTKAQIHPATCQQSRLVVIQWYFLGNFFIFFSFFWHPWCSLNTTLHYLSIVADYVYPFNTTVYLSSVGFFIKLKFAFYRFTVFKCPQPRTSWICWNARFSSWMCSRS